jgi:glutamate-5-semialdehyde dehydrogenase
LPDPVGEVIDSSRRPNGLDVSRVRVPLGVVFFVYESRPNVTADAAAICIKSGNAVILRGGKEAYYSSRAIVDVLLQCARESGLPEDSVQLVDVADREAVGHFLQLESCIDVAIPRGGESLIRRVAEQARMPVIKHYTGNCHVYVDASADLETATRIIVNAKCQRPGVCNACETLLIHQDVAADYLPTLGAALQEQQVVLRACDQSRPYLVGAEVATDEDFRTEFLDLILAVKTVEHLDEAIDHINAYGSGHTDAIVTSDLKAARRFTNRVDASAVMVNASTRFNDGSQFGLGAEIGISTDKLHARGPCGLRELTTYKYVCFGDGLIRE